MKRAILRFLAVITAASFFATGCYSHRVVATPSGEMVVVEAPPSPRHEVIGIAPSASHVWVQGYWSHRHGRWVWVPGHWELRPRATATWVPGHWDQTSRGWVWTPGHWD